MQIGDLIELRIEHLGSRAEGVGTFNETKIFVAKTAPGDLVRARLTTKMRGQWIAQLIDIIQASPQRSKALCPHFLECGGCDLQHIPYAEQVTWKSQLVAHWIRRSPLAPHFDPKKIEIFASPREFHYRHRTKIQIKNSQPAFYRPRSRDLLFLKECPILEEGLWNKLSEDAVRLESAEDRLINWSPSERLEYRVEDRLLEYGEDCFTQGNLYQNDRLIRLVTEEIEKVSGLDLAWDLFAGIGNFSAVLARRFKKVIAVESNSSAVKFGRKNLPEVEWRSLEVRKSLASDLMAQSPNLIILDPSREGALHEIRQLAPLKNTRLIYVSCQLDSGIRDLTALLKLSPWKIERWCVVDLFPQTRHVESVISLTSPLAMQ